MISIAQSAQQVANSSGLRCWVVVPRDGQPYIAYSPAQIQPSYEQLITFIPADNYLSCWTPNTLQP